MNPTTIEAISTFFNDYPLQKYKKGHLLILPGEMTETAYFLVEGKIKVYDKSYRGDEIIITNRIPPNLFPISFVLNSEPTRYYYEASTDITVHMAPTSDVRQFFDANPKIVLDLLSTAYTVLNNVLERMVHYITSNAKHRLIYALITECREFGTEELNNSYRINVNEKEIGSRAGLSRETVSREARSLKRMKLLEVHHNYMIIPDLQRLESYLNAR